MKLYNWAELPEEDMSPTISRQVIHAERVTIARIHLKKGAIVPMHQHGNEQITMLERGKLRFVISGEEQILCAGQTLPIPPDAPHMVEALEDSLATDLFSPVREDWIRGEDAYLRGQK